MAKMPKSPIAAAAIIQASSVTVKPVALELGAASEIRVVVVVFVACDSVSDGDVAVVVAGVGSAVVVNEAKDKGLLPTRSSSTLPLL